MIKKIAIGIVIAYASVVVLFESLLGYYQPQSDGTLTITTTNAAGAEADRVLSSIRVKDRLYVAANHWPRAWFRQTLDNPDVMVTIDGERSAYKAVAIRDEEHETVNSASPLPLGFRVLTGFPPRYFIRLDQR
tara:strand:- start:1069 stop:1467 length:399 start_codon:yes stop_codon:yes gene_type:complete